MAQAYDHLGNEATPHNSDGVAVIGRGIGETPHASPLTDPFTRYGVQPVGQSGYGDPVFSDEFKMGFNAAKWEPYYPDTAFWNTTVPGGHLTNSNEPQGYDLSAISFDADGMVLTMRHEETVEGLAYTSGMITSYPSFNPIYGYFEARMKLSNTNGAWPAFWMFPTNQVWPPEIDIMENWGKASYNLQTEHTFHYPRPTPGSYSGSTYGYPQDIGNDFHVWGCRWEPGRIRWYVDGQLAKDLTIVETYANRQMFLILNFAGAHGSSPQVPASVKIDYVRAWALPG
jgi:beta-glucanase (GH16 family)